MASAASSAPAEAAIDLLPLETWCRSLSFVLQDRRSLLLVSAVGRLFHQAVAKPLSWQGALACVGLDDLEASKKAGPNAHRFETWLSLAGLCSRAFLDFKGGHSPARRFAAQRCFLHLAGDCPNISCLSVHNWCAFERTGLCVLQSAWPSLRHVELSGCDYIASYEAMIPFFQAHQELLSFRATFHPRASATTAFVDALPPSLMALGFVNFTSEEALARLLERCPLEHLWLAANGRLPEPLVAALVAGGGGLRTLSLPTQVSEGTCLSIVKACSQVQLLCRMRTSMPAFGTGALAEEFEELPGGHGVLVRRRGSSVELAPNGTMWAPYDYHPGVLDSTAASSGPGESAADRAQGEARALDEALAATAPPRGDAWSAAARAAAAAAAGRW